VGEVVTIPYAPREVFLPFHERTQRWSALVAHRRAGKTVACVNDLLKAALTCDKQSGRFAYIAPQYNQAKDIAWGYVKQFAGVVPGVEFNESELRADLPNGARIRLYGADNPDRLRGIYLDGVVLDEYADMRPSVWGEIVRPLLTDRQGWATFIGTPKGKNAFWEVWDAAKSEPAKWYATMLKASETALIPAEELAEARKQMSEDQYAQEFECSFEAAIQGAYYGVEMRRAEEEKRIAGVPHEPGTEVFTAWDLGIGDSTAIWFAQAVAREIHIIDYYEASGVGLDHYAKVLREKPYLYGRHFLPHDAAKSELGTGKTIQEVLASLGVRDTAIAPKLSIEEGINAARLLIPRCWFDAGKCKQGLEALKQYRKEYDEKLKTFKLRPLHDWASHGADAFRYLAVSVDKMNAAKSLPPIKYRPQGIV
jgi:phage terminase large subunit